MNRSSHNYRRISAVITMVLLLASAVLIVLPAGDESAAAESPTKGVGVYRNGPKVNRSVVIFNEEDALLEGFDDVEDFLRLVGNGDSDIFYDPNNEWDLDIYKPGNDTFQAQYPSGYRGDNEVITLGFQKSFRWDENFGQVSIVSRDLNFNSIIYGEQYFKIKIFAENKSGISMAELWLEIKDVNDKPGEYSDADFFSISFSEDTYFRGVNSDHDPPSAVIFDKYDPYDVLTYAVEPANDLAKNITAVIEPDGSNITFTPAPNWACPYLTYSKRLTGNDHEKYANFWFNVTDSAGESYIKKNFWVYVLPVNDEPYIDNPGTLYFDEDSMVDITFTGGDPDVGWDQEIAFGTNISEEIFRQTEIQIDFLEGYEWDSEEGHIAFPTDNSMVGIYPVSARIRDKPLATHADYQTTPYPVYANFTLQINNTNDPPRAAIGSPQQNVKYNTTYPIEFNASLSRDADLIHGQPLNYTWYIDDQVLGYGEILRKVIPEEGIYKIRLNITDGTLFSEEEIQIDVRQSVIPGQKFEGKDIDRSYEADNVSDPIALYRGEDGDQIRLGGDNTLDIKSVSGRRDGASYKIIVRFTEKLQFVYLPDDKTQDPTLKVYFVKEDFVENPPYITLDRVPGYDFYGPANAYVYSRIEVDLRGKQVVYPQDKDINPQFRVMADEMSVEITLTVIELDFMEVQPDFQLFSTAYMKTTIVRTQSANTIIQSWDTAGYGSQPTVTKPTVENTDNGNGDGSVNWGIVFLLIFLVLIIIIVIVVVVVVIVKKSGEVEAAPAPVPRKSIEEELGIHYDDTPPPQVVDTQEITPGKLPDSGWSK
ncbi:MAG: hypothetical protein ACMUIG_03450 [Thermoplasmatota archaeon]